MIIDCHGHYTTAPEELWAFRERQVAAFQNGTFDDFTEAPDLTDDQIRESIEGAQLKLQAERGTDVSIFSPRASQMGHHLGDERLSKVWSRMQNDIIARVCALFPGKFVGVGQLPQAPGASPAGCVDELERCVNELGFVGVNLSPDPSGGYWQSPPLTDKSFYPLFEKMVELDVPAMVHVTASCNPAAHMTGAHYLNADTTAFMQFLLSDLFVDFPTLKMIVPHGGGAVPYHWGRYRGLAQDLKRPPLEELLLHNVYFDTCVYHLPGMETLMKVIPVDNILFASEMIGAVRSIDPTTGFYFDDTKRYVDQIEWLSDEDRTKIFEINSRRVFPRLSAALGDS
jgi:4-oxalmesaconate hydratase